MIGKLASGAKQAAEKGHISGENLERHASGAEAHIDFIDFMPGINPRHTARIGFSAACKAQVYSRPFTARLKSCPFKAMTRARFDAGVRHG